MYKVRYKIDGKLHRTDGPAYMKFGHHAVEAWYLNGKCIGKYFPNSPTTSTFSQEKFDQYLYVLNKGLFAFL